MRKLIAVAVAGLVIGCSGGGTPPAPKIQTAPYGDEVFSKYTVRDYPKTFRAWGRDGVKLIEMAERNAAKAAEFSGKCDAIAYVGLSESRSVAPKKPVAFADCNNGERFYVALGDQPEVAKAQSEKLVSKDRARSDCMSMVRDAEAFPSSVDFDIGGITATDHRTTGAVSVGIDYTAKNPLGADVPRHGRCLFPSAGPPEVVLSIR